MTGSRGPGPSRSKKTDQNLNRSQQIIYKRNLWQPSKRRGTRRGSGTGRRRRQGVGTL
ncbi:BQ5605_C003g02130 [Microbotryum silenes-dioicae]|uniref:BQ5605_C003g02130 protein n=1 Tax=Microbotryum silenes-dioicae TaxID=796604 RepID=A0A2X0P3E0_9BASI|nr:BQ5605_C003g02130 [Microbotryum silenes-dioicae]